jgi:hypothetical protein
LPRFGDGPGAIRFRHIIHAYRDHSLPQNTQVQAITFDSVRRAARFAADDVSAHCVAVTYVQDADLVPWSAILAPYLTRSVGDLAEFAIARHLPLLFDVLDHGCVPQLPGDADDLADYVILTNSDIHVQPGFYSVLAALIRQGYDVITVNRRTLDVPVEERDYSALFLADGGQDHPVSTASSFPVPCSTTSSRRAVVAGQGM